MDCDDGVNPDAYDQADLILVGVSRSGKTPTCVYLAMHFGLYCANYPLTEDDYLDDGLPSTLGKYRDRLVGLTIDARRLHEIRQKRRPDSEYARLDQCQIEVRRAEDLFRHCGILMADTSGISVEEIATTLLQKTGLRREYLG
jgi:regulator of PEP synthase PpsR (kinase-PPPase family)